MLPLWIILALIIIVVIWVVKTQNKLVHLDELCGNAMSQIGVQQASRWDALIALAKQVQQYSQHEYKALSEIIEKRQGIDQKAPVSAAEGQYDLLSQLGTRLMAVAEAYPDLKSAALYQETMSGINKYEDNVRYSRMIYNDTVTKFNRVIRSFPASLIAGMLGFATREYLAADEAKSQMPDLTL